MLSKKSLYFLAFIEGFTVMILEILGKNILTPFFGNSLTIWTIVIGNTFFFLSVGYLLAIKFLKKDKLKVLQVLFVLLTIWILLLQVFAYYLLPLFLSASINVGATISHVILFGPLFILFGLIPPILIALYEEQFNNDNLGKNTALIFSVSTLGGVLACLIITSMFASNIEIHKMLILSGVLVFSVLMYYFKNLKFKTFALIIALVVYNFFFADKLFYQLKNISIIYHSNDLYGDLKIYDQKEGQFVKRFISVNNIPQSNIENNFYVYSNWNYVHRISMFASMKSNKKALLVGMGGGTIASELQKLNMDVDVVDIDARMFEIAEKYYYFQDKSCDFYVNDARYFLNISRKKYDLIVFDVLNGESQPNNLFTLEGINEMKKSLKSDGMIIVEFQDMSDVSALAYKAICNTFFESDLNVYLSHQGKGLIDYLIISSPSNIDFSSINPQNFTLNAKNAGSWVSDFLRQPVLKIKNPFENSVILTDDLPILDKLCEKPRRIWRKTFINPEM